MFTYTTTYSTQAAGNRMKVLATTGTTDGPVTSTLVTMDAEVAPKVAAQLTKLGDNRRVRLARWALAHPGEVCFERRTLMRAVLTGNPADTDAQDLGDLLAGSPVAERRAIADEVGRLYDGTEDILVPVTLADEFGGLRFLALANEYLGGEGADHLEELALAVLDGTETGIFYEGVLAYLRAGDEDIDAACDTDWVDVFVDEPGFTAWLRHHHHDLAVAYGCED